MGDISGVRNPLIINGVPVVTGPAEIDITIAEQLRVVLLASAVRGHTTVVVDLTRTRFCDSAGFSVLVRAHKRALAEGGELRLVIPSDGAVFRVFALLGLHGLIPCFSSLDQALAPRPVRPVSPPAAWAPRLGRGVQIGFAGQPDRPDQRL